MDTLDIISLKYPEAQIPKDFHFRELPDKTVELVWLMEGVAKPTQKDLDAWAIEVAPIKEAASIRQARRDEYMPIGDQLDALWHAMDDGRLPQIEPIYSTHKAIKEKHKKKGE